jgi:hypothetical protein
MSKIPFKFNSYSTFWDRRASRPVVYYKIGTVWNLVPASIEIRVLLKVAFVLPRLYYIYNVCQLLTAWEKFEILGIIGLRSFMKTEGIYRNECEEQWITN